MLKSKVTNKFHKINRNWQGQRLLPVAPFQIALTLLRYAQSVKAIFFR
jgi:hypothetical protein